MRSPLFPLLLVLPWIAAAAAPPDPFASRRLRMVAEIEADVAATSREIGKKALDRRLMDALARVPRHEFVPADVRDRAYENRPLPIGFGQTISQPYIVALMTDLLGVGPGDAVLEVGTGSGYQAAILAELGCRVSSVEIIPELAARARQALDRVGYGRVAVKAADGYYGWEDRSPFRAIVVTAAASHVPQPLLRQLGPGGRMVIPVGGPFLTQQLVLVEKARDGSVTTRSLLPVVFVPLTGGH